MLTWSPRYQGERAASGAGTARALTASGAGIVKAKRALDQALSLSARMRLPWTATMPLRMGNPVPTP